jgi:hypothetical protein
MEKFAKIYVMDGNKVVGTAEDMNDVNDVINEYTNGESEFSFSNVNLRVLNVVDELYIPEGMLKYKPGKIHIGDMSESDDEEVVLEISEGYWSGNKFGDEDELAEFLMEKVNEGELKVEDIHHISITQTVVNSASFDDAWQDSGEWRIDVSTFEPTETAIYNRMGVEFISVQDMNKHMEDIALPKPKSDGVQELTFTPAEMFEEVNKQVAEALANHVKKDLQPVEVMTDEDIKDEYHALLERLRELKAEQLRRQDPEAYELLNN